MQFSQGQLLFVIIFLVVVTLGWCVYAMVLRSALKKTTHELYTMIDVFQENNLAIQRRENANEERLVTAWRKCIILIGEGKYLSTMELISKVTFLNFQHKRTLLNIVRLSMPVDGRSAQQLLDGESPTRHH